MYDFIFGGKEEIHPNKQCRTYHMRSQFIEKGRFFSYASMSLQDELYFCNGISLIISEIMAIDGVTHINISPYELGLGKAEAFNWEEIVPQLKRVLALRLQIN